MRQYPAVTGKHRIAARLTELTKGRIVVEHEPGTYLPSRKRQSLGHQYWAYPTFDCEEEIGLTFYLDDSKPESLKSQLVAGLREAAQSLRDLAWEIESAGKPDRGIEGMGDAEGGSGNE